MAFALSLASGRAYGLGLEGQDLGFEDTSKDGLLLGGGIRHITATQTGLRT